MNKLILSYCLLFCIYPIHNFAQFEFFDDFDSYITGQNLCVQTNEWRTWTGTPGALEDPFVVNSLSLSYPNSIQIIHYNDLIRLFGNYSSGRNHITFYAYIPESKSGEVSLYSKFSPDPNELAFECYFDSGGTGRLMSIPGEPVLFNYSYNQWQTVWVVVDFDRDEAQFYLDNNFIHIWEWTQNGTISNQIAAQNFYGRFANYELYFDDYYLFENDCLGCYLPTEPSDLTAQQNLNTESIIQLNWQPSINYWDTRAYKIIRKIGLPFEPTEFETIRYVSDSVLQFIDSSIVVDSTYTYGVIAMNMYGYSDTSNFATITVSPVTNIDQINNPLVFSLSQNYPNPFNSTTKINYILPEGTFVSLIVYDCLASNVKTLVNEFQEAGLHQVLFVEDNLPSGLYFLRIMAGEWDQTRKMILLK